MTNPATDVAVIADLEDRRWAAIIDLDLATLAELISDDLTYTHSNGRRDTKTSYLELVPIVRYLSADRRDREIRVFDRVAIVTGRADIKIDNRETGSKRDVSILYTDVWLKTGEAWRFTAWQATPIPA